MLFNTNMFNRQYKQKQTHFWLTNNTKQATTTACLQQQLGSVTMIDRKHARLLNKQNIKNLSGTMLKRAKTSEIAHRIKSKEANIERISNEHLARQHAKPHYNRCGRRCLHGNKKSI